MNHPREIHFREPLSFPTTVSCNPALFAHHLYFSASLAKNIGRRKNRRKQKLSQSLSLPLSPMHYTIRWSTTCGLSLLHESLTIPPDERGIVCGDSRRRRKWTSGKKNGEKRGRRKGRKRRNVSPRVLEETRPRPLSFSLSLVSFLPSRRNEQE